MSAPLAHAPRLAEVDAGFRSLPDRYLGSDPGFDAGFRSLPDRYLGSDPGFDVTYHLRLCDLGHTWATAVALAELERGQLAWSLRQHARRRAESGTDLEHILAELDPAKSSPEHERAGSAMPPARFGWT